MPARKQPVGVRKNPLRVVDDPVSVVGRSGSSVATVSRRREPPYTPREMRQMISSEHARPLPRPTCKSSEPSRPSGGEGRSTELQPSSGARDWPFQCLVARLAMGPGRLRGRDTTKPRHLRTLPTTLGSVLYDLRGTTGVFPEQRCLFVPCWCRLGRY
jgi:hypothetical protein